MNDTAKVYHNRAFRGAYNKGRRAAMNGLRRECPYRDLRTFRGQRAGHQQTFSRGFIRAWYKGYDDEKAAPSAAAEGRLL